MLHMLHTNRGYLPSMDQDPIYRSNVSFMDDPNDGWQQRSISGDLPSMDEGHLVHGCKDYPWIEGPYWWIFAAIRGWGPPPMRPFIHGRGPDPWMMAFDPWMEDIHGSCATHRDCVR